MAYGRYLEEFTIGEVFRHWPGRTISEADCTWFALLTMNQHPIHSDANYAEKHTQHKQRLVLGPLVFSIGIPAHGARAQEEPPDPRRAGVRAYRSTPAPGSRSPLE